MRKSAQRVGLALAIVAGSLGATTTALAAPATAAEAWTQSPSYATRAICMSEMNRARKDGYETSSGCFEFNGWIYFYRNPS
jgi:hypothetical protein